MKRLARPARERRRDNNWKTFLLSYGNPESRKSQLDFSQSLSALSSHFSLLASLSLSRSLSCSLFCYRLYSIASTQTYTCTGWLSLVRDFDRDENVHDGFPKFLWIVLPLTRLSTSPPLIFHSTFVILFPVSFSTTSNDLYTFPFQITSLYYF